MGKILFLIGLLGIAFTVLYDKIVKGEQIVFGPKSCTAIAVCGILIVLGLVFWKRGTPCDTSGGTTQSRETENK